MLSWFSKCRLWKSLDLFHINFYCDQLLVNKAVLINKNHFSYTNDTKKKKMKTTMTQPKKTTGQEEVEGDEDEEAEQQQLNVI